MNEQTIMERVAAGLAWIKENAETLNLDLDRVDVDTLNVNSGYDCPLAQAAGRSWFAVTEDAVSHSFAPEDDTGWDPVSDAWATAHGFVASGRLRHPEALNAEWRRVILAERV